jgi:hypothetical protein
LVKPSFRADAHTVKAGLREYTPAGAFVFDTRKNCANPSNFPDFVNPVTRYCRPDD